MKTKLLLMTLAVFTVFASCKKDEYAEIKEAFQKYVDENFGEPDDFKEITSIGPIGTLDFTPLKKKIDELLDTDSTSLQLQEKILSWNLGVDPNVMLKITTKYPYEFKNKMERLSNKMLVEYHYQTRNKIKDIMKNIESTDFGIHYLIKARIVSGKTKKIENYYANKDSKGDIIIYEGLSSLKDLTHIYEGMYEDDIELLISYREMTTDLCKRIKEMANSCGITID